MRCSVDSSSDNSTFRLDVAVGEMQFSGLSSLGCLSLFSGFRMCMDVEVVKFQ